MLVDNPDGQRPLSSALHTAQMANAAIAARVSLIMRVFYEDIIPRESKSMGLVDITKAFHVLTVGQ
jgi:ribulose 1,5-bisphosphate synthetase/thiazole synthase